MAMGFSVLWLAAWVLTGAPTDDPRWWVGGAACAVIDLGRVLAKRLNGSDEIG